MQNDFVMLTALAMAMLGVAGGCSKPGPQSAAMSAKEQRDLRECLAELDEVLREKSPFILDKLAPGADVAEIEKLRAELGVARIEPLEIWFERHNGGTDRVTELLPLGRPLSISESLENRKLLQATPFVDEKIKRSLKLLEDVAGDGFYLDLTEPSPRVFYCMLEDPYPAYYGTLPDFVAFVSKVHEGGLATLNSNGMIDFNQVRYLELESKHLAETDLPIE